MSTLTAVNGALNPPPPLPDEFELPLLLSPEEIDREYANQYFQRGLDMLASFRNESVHQVVRTVQNGKNMRRVLVGPSTLDGAIDIELTARRVLTRAEFLIFRAVYIQERLAEDRVSPKAWQRIARKCGDAFRKIRIEAYFTRTFPDMVESDKWVADVIAGIQKQNRIEAGKAKRKRKR